MIITDDRIISALKNGDRISNKWSRMSECFYRLADGHKISRYSNKGHRIDFSCEVNMTILTDDSWEIVPKNEEINGDREVCDD